MLWRQELAVASSVGCWTTLLTATPSRFPSTATSSAAPQLLCPTRKKPVSLAGSPSPSPSPGPADIQLRGPRSARIYQAPQECGLQFRWGLRPWGEDRCGWFCWCHLWIVLLTSYPPNGHPSLDASSTPQVLLRHLDPWPTHTCAGLSLFLSSAPNKRVSLPSSKVRKHTGQKLIPSPLRKTSTWSWSPLFHPEFISFFRFLNFVYFYWSIVDLQCCANLCNTAKWLV